MATIHKGDIVFLQGYGVAAMALGKGPKKRTEEDDKRFAQSFEKLVLVARTQ